MGQNNQKLTQVLSDFLKVPIDSIHDGTRLDRSVFGSSIHLHRFYALLMQEGF